MSGQPESISFSDNGAIAMVQRADKGVVLINFSGKDQKLKLKTDLANGTYTDEVNKQQFKVSDSVIKGKLAPNTTYIIYAK